MGLRTVLVNPPWRRICLLGLALTAVAIGLAPSVAAAQRARKHNAAPSLTDNQLIGQHLIYPFEEDTPPVQLTSRIQNGELAGVIVRTFQGGAQLATTLNFLQSLPRPEGLNLPLMMMVDEEGGRNTEYSWLYSTPPADLGLMQSKRELQYLIRRMSLGLLTHHMNVNLAPVVDVPRPGTYTAVTRRGFSSNPHKVVRVTKLWLEASRNAGLVSVLKHFPGQGAAPGDEDVHADRINLTAPQLRANDELPFMTALHDRRAAMMVSSGVFPAFGELPAMINRSLIDGELRGRLGYQGVVVSDDITNAAFRPWGNPVDIALKSLEAGNDVLITSPPAEFIRVEAALRKALHDGVLHRDLLTRSLPRIRALRALLKR